jgi:hypothetical protein
MEKKKFCNLCFKEIKEKKSNGQKYHAVCFIKNRKKYNKDYRIKHREHFREIDKKRYPKRKVNPNFIKSLRKSNKTYKKKHPERLKAQILSQYIPLKSNCEICQSTENLQRHHPDYSKPKNFITLCLACHNQAHWRKI